MQRWERTRRPWWGRHHYLREVCYLRHVVLAPNPVCIGLEDLVGVGVTRMYCY